MSGDVLICSYTRYTSETNRVKPTAIAENMLLRLLSLLALLALTQAEITELLNDELEGPNVCKKREK